MTSHSLLGPIASHAALGRALLEAIRPGCGLGVPQFLADLNARAREIDADHNAVGSLCSLDQLCYEKPIPCPHHIEMEAPQAQCMHCRCGGEVTVSGSVLLCTRCGYGASVELSAPTQPAPAPVQVDEWPKRRACVPYEGGTRLVGFVIDEGSKAYGEFGLSEPLFWLDRMCAHPPAPAADGAGELPPNGLLPCPFCGDDAERIDFGPGDGENEGGSCISCTSCQASGNVEFGRKENFISNWNRRAAIAALRQPVPDAVRELQPVDLTKFRGPIEALKHFYRSDLVASSAEHWGLTNGIDEGVAQCDELLALIASQQESRNAD